MAVSGDGTDKLGVLDVSRAFFNAEITEETYVELPEELQSQYPGMCWKLRKAMYGTRAAANSWAREYTAKMLSWNFKRGRSTPCIFHHSDRRLMVMGDGDDFVSLGPQAKRAMVSRTDAGRL